MIEDTSQPETIPSEKEQTASLPAVAGFSKYWDIYLPLGISSVPAGCFKLMRLVTAGADQPGAGIATWQIATMVVLQTVGVIGMAVVILLRMELGLAQLRHCSGNRMLKWRRLCLILSIMCLACFDMCLNVGVGFNGAGAFIAASVVWYLIYLIGIRITFFRLPAAGIQTTAVR
ncbi:MAG: hypothetical protein ACK58L_16835 [Planctomycetota bacterium]